MFNLPLDGGGNGISLICNVVGLGLVKVAIVIPSGSERVVIHPVTRCNDILYVLRISGLQTVPDWLITSHVT